jgi:hypothetical protein
MVVMHTQFGGTRMIDISVGDPLQGFVEEALLTSRKPPSGNKQRATPTVTIQTFV